MFSGDVMKGLILSIIAAGLIGTPAFAADLRVKAPVRATPAPAPVYSWTGWYVGGNVGYSGGTDDTTVTAPGPQATAITVAFGGASGLFSLGPLVYGQTTHLNGAIGGVQIGYNWQTTSNWILGFEADFQASGESASAKTHQTESDFTVEEFGEGFSNFATLQNIHSISQNAALLWFGTVRGRVGRAIWPTVMLYGTGGLAFGRLRESFNESFNATCTTNLPSCVASLTFANGTTVVPPFSVNQAIAAAVTKTGRILGMGIEGVVPNTNLTLKAEYLHMNLGTQNYSSSNPILGTILVGTSFNDEILRVGMNYQLH